ncbi:MAG TPA: DUF2314 domain-containing protein [Anaerolineales bacterium]|nr:DUF2314 domain-containing protein [Anaerolineales bacterium]
MYKPLQLTALWLMCVIFTLSCASSSLEGTPVSDEEFDAAVKEAHGTLSTLRQALLSPRENYIFVGLKVRFTGADEYEDIWTEPVDYYDGFFTTRMIDGVLIDSGLNTERMVSVPMNKVLDWVIVEDDGNLIGGYTIKLSYEHMTPEEKKEFLRVTGYKLE